jgi:hypothetical protein
MYRRISGQFYCYLIINYISKSCLSLSKKILKLQNFVSGVPPAIFSKNARILTVIFIGHRQLNNTYYLYLLTTAYTATPFCSSNLLFIQQLLDILYSFKEKKKKTGRYYVLKESCMKYYHWKLQFKARK